jgi:hypothetical protein
MRKSFYIFGLVLGLLSLNQLACADTDKSTGVGFILGDPTGFTANFWRDEAHSIDAGLAFSFNNFVTVYSDYLWHFSGAFEGTDLSEDRVIPYVGVGAVLFVSGDTGRKDGDYFTQNGDTVGLGVRVPFGLEWKPNRTSIAVYAEIAPGVGIVPSTFGFVQGGLGVRYYF